MQASYNIKKNTNNIADEAREIILNEIYKEKSHLNYWQTIHDIWINQLHYLPHESNEDMNEDYLWITKRLNTYITTKKRMIESNLAEPYKLASILINMMTIAIQPKDEGWSPRMNTYAVLRNKWLKRLLEQTNILIKLQNNKEE